MQRTPPLPLKTLEAIKAKEAVVAKEMKMRGLHRSDANGNAVPKLRKNEVAKPVKEEWNRYLLQILEQLGECDKIVCHTHT